jgi:hypothetical protein
LIGCESDSDLVVAPISVNGLIGILTFHHSGITISITKSSIAIYKTSSIFGLSLWISSINKMSPFSKVLSIEIISEGLVMAYPVTALMVVVACLEMMFASVVLPNQLGPEKRI